MNIFTTLFARGVGGGDRPMKGRARASLSLSLSLSLASTR